MRPYKTNIRVSLCVFTIGTKILFVDQPNIKKKKLADMFAGKTEWNSSLNLKYLDVTVNMTSLNAKINYVTREKNRYNNVKYLGDKGFDSIFGDSTAKCFTHNIEFSIERLREIVIKMDKKVLKMFSRISIFIHHKGQLLRNGLNMIYNKENKYLKEDTRYIDFRLQGITKLVRRSDGDPGCSEESEKDDDNNLRHAAETLPCSAPYPGNPVTP